MNQVTIETPRIRTLNIFDEKYMGKLYNSATDLVLRSDPQIRREFQEAGILIFKTEN